MTDQPRPSADFAGLFPVGVALSTMGRDGVAILTGVRVTAFGRSVGLFADRRPAEECRARAPWIFSRPVNE